MATSSNVQIKIDLPFPRAGVVFAIAVESPEGKGGTPTFSLTARDAAGGGAVPFTLEACPPMADWVRGYTRWLRRARVTASHDTEAVTGTFDEGLTPEQLLQGVQDACDMVRQRFDLYEENILT